MKLLRAFVVLALAVPASAQYAGPAILSRGEAPAAMNTPSVEFALSVAVTGNYTTGLLGVATNSQGQLIAPKGVFGMGATLGLSGAHQWRHTSLGLAYSGSFYDYSAASYFAGLNQGISLGLTHQFSRHVLFNLRESAGMFTQFPPDAVSLNSSVSFDPSQSYIPSTDFFNNRTIYSSTQGTLVFQASERLSFSAGGGYFASVRRSSDLYSSHGDLANADVQYRLSRHYTVGASFGFDQFDFSKGIGHSQIFSQAVSISGRLTRWTEFSLFGGAARVNSSFEEVVPINPAFLAILCPPGITVTCNLPNTFAINNQLFWAPDFGVRISRAFHRGVIYASAAETITPGNGLFLTSRAQTASAGYGYSGLRKWSMNLGTYYVKALSLGNVQGGYGELTGLFSISHELFSHISFVTSFHATQYRSSTFSPYNRLIYSGTIGLAYSTKDIPVRFF